MLEPDGTVIGWTLDENGAAGWILGLGHNDRAVPYTAHAVAGLTNVVSVAIGDSTSFAVLDDGRVMAWGGNARGNLGNTPLTELEATAGPRATANMPIVIPELTNVTAVATHHDHALALRRDGTVYAWGLGYPNIVSSTPAPVAGVSGVRELAFADLHALALLQNGTIISWGSGNAGESGHTGVDPAPIGGLTNVQSIAATASRSFAVLQDGRIMTWGVPLWGARLRQSRHEPIPYSAYAPGTAESLRRLPGRLTRPLGRRRLCSLRDQCSQRTAPMYRSSNAISIGASHPASCIH